jgi:hypothetical protein
MKVHELIDLLSGYDQECEVTCIVEDSTWEWNGEYSVEVTTVNTEQIISILVSQQSDGTILIGRRY